MLDARARRLPDVVRASVHYYNTEEEVTRFVAAVAAAGLGPRAGATTPRAARAALRAGAEGRPVNWESAARRVMLFPCPPSASARRPSSVLGLALLTVAALASRPERGSARPERGREVAIAWHVTIASSWFDPSTAPPQITPFGILYALHDALVRPLPGQKHGHRASPSRGRRAPTGSRYEFKLRARASSSTTAIPSPAEDVKFSFDRYKGAGASRAAGARAAGGGRSIR